ncbi:hypothetical protein [Planococcus alpniumensis]|uniref:hypothetical protein n=1 Tax=Planococcus alpniumensis TaxID=2708345 RepID=UPI001B8A8FB8|nr:hypothetical protein [Planococcus sp. MSAK28401]
MTRKKIPKFFVDFQLYMVVVIFFLLILYIYDNGENVSFVRGVYGYINLIFLPLAAYLIFKSISEKHLERAIKLFYAIWVLGGITQLFYPAFISSWKMRNVISEGRGVISFSNEPAYFSITLILMTIMLILINYDKNKKYIYFTILISLILSQSAVGFIYSMFVLLLFGIKQINFKKLILYLTTLLMGVLITTLVLYINVDSRLSLMLLSLIQDPLKILLSDISLNIRFAHLYISLKGFLENLLLPNGIHTWGDYYKNEVLNNKSIFIEPAWRLENSNGKIVSMHGSLLYELGILCFPIYAFIYSILRNNKNSNKLIILLIIMGINGLTITNPIFLFLLGFLVYKGVKQDV